MSIRIFDHFEVGPLACNCYIVGDPDAREAIVIDPGGDADTIASALAEKELRVTAIVATHAHFDHVIAAQRIRELTGAPFYLHDADKPLLSWYRESGRIFLGVDLPDPPDVDSSPSEGDRVRAGSVELEVVHTPGHSPGSISLVTGDVIFSGDTLFAGSIGRTDLPGGDAQALVSAVRHKLFEWPDQTPVHPGHGPATTVGRERSDNPFVGASARMWLPGD